MLIRLLILLLNKKMDIKKIRRRVYGHDRLIFYDKNIKNALLNFLSCYKCFMDRDLRNGKPVNFYEKICAL